MTQSFETIAAFRFGLGFAPGQAEVISADALIAQTRGPDTMAEVFPGVDYATRWQNNKEFARLRKMRNQKAADYDKKAFNKVRRVRRTTMLDDTRRIFLRAIYSPQSFRERLAMFWADHFTVVPGNQIELALWGDYIDDGIRPHVGGSFGDLLISAVTHPSMLIYLDQNRSTGPNSPRGQEKNDGLNENLAREILELHTIGVGGSYTQTDVRELAELLTGLSIGEDGMRFARRRAEPGAETVLGRRYGGNRANVSDIEAFLQDVAIHPDTARHICTKLAVHFIDDLPASRLIAQMTETYLATDGDLPSVYGAMLDHPNAWQPLGSKVKQPLDFMISGLRALGIPPHELSEMPLKQADRMLGMALASMGQPIKSAPGPNGWPEEAEAWITAQGLAARLQWALLNAQRFGQDIDPREFVDFALRDAAGPTLRQAVAGAERRAEGLTLVLASPEFNRR